MSLEEWNGKRKIGNTIERQLKYTPQVGEISALDQTYNASLALFREAYSGAGAFLQYFLLILRALFPLKRLLIYRPHGTKHSIQMIIFMLNEF
jgi:hypothetical protein